MRFSRPRLIVVVHLRPWQDTSVQHSLQGSGLVHTFGAGGGPSRHRGTHHNPSLPTSRIDDAGPFARTGLCCPGRHHYYGPLRRPLGRRPLPGLPGYRSTCFPPPAAAGPRRASPVPRSTVQPFRSPYAGEFLGTRSRTRSAFHGLHSPKRARLSLALPAGRSRMTALQDSLDATDQSLATPPIEGRDIPLRRTGSHPPPGTSLPGTLASPRTGLTPAGRH
jgi:hypothetical protein